MNKKLFFPLLLILIFGLSTIFAQDSTKPFPKRISGGVVNGKAISLPIPEYSIAARQVNVGGSVNVQIIIDHDGKVTDAKAVSGHPLLRQASVDAARNAKFAPTFLSGVPVEVSGVLVYYFNPSTSTKTSGNFVEDETIPMAFSLLLGIYDNLKSDTEFIGIIDDMFEEISKADSSLKLNGKFSEKTPGEQTELIKKVKEILTTSDNPSAVWQFQMGSEVGELMGHVFSQFLGKGELVSETDLLHSLNDIKSLTTTAPKSFPTSVLSKLKTLGNFSSRKDLGKEETQKEIIKTLLELFEMITPK